MYNLKQNRKSSLNSEEVDDFSKSRTAFEIKYRKWELDFQKQFGIELKLENLKFFVSKYIEDQDFKNYIFSKLSTIFSELKNEKDYMDFINFLKTNGVIFND